MILTQLHAWGGQSPGLHVKSREHALAPVVQLGKELLRLVLHVPDSYPDQTAAACCICLRTASHLSGAGRCLIAWLLIDPWLHILAARPHIAYEGLLSIQGQRIIVVPATLGHLGEADCQQQAARCACSGCACYHSRVFRSGLINACSTITLF